MDQVKGGFNDQVHACNVVAYCPYHKWYLTIRQMKKIGCLARQCQQLERVENNFWFRYDQKKKEKREKKRGQV